MPPSGQRGLCLGVALASALGFAFAAVSSSDFVAHLDRQVHGIHCSFIPGAGTPDVSGTSGCHATLMSPYSSVMRDSVWGGIPVSLPAMAVFAYLVFAALAIVATWQLGLSRLTILAELAILVSPLRKCGYIVGNLRHGRRRRLPCPLVKWRRAEAHAGPVSARCTTTPTPQA